MPIRSCRNVGSHISYRRQTPRQKCVIRTRTLYFAKVKLHAISGANSNVKEFFQST